MGRPRSEEAHARVLAAAGELFASQGIDATSMDAIADTSGVSKATIYKHWPDKVALCLEVMSSLHDADAVAAPQPSGDVRADLIAALNRQAPKPRSELRARIMPHFIAYAARTPGFGEIWRVRVIDPPRLQLVALLERAVAEGELSPDLDVESTAVSLLGAMVYRNLLRQTGGHPPEFLVESVVGTVWRAHGVSRRGLRARPKIPAFRSHASSSRA